MTPTTPSSPRCFNNEHRFTDPQVLTISPLLNATLYFGLFIASLYSFAFPVLLAGANGEATTQFVDGNFMIKDLFGATGSTIVMHAAPDNYANIPPRYAANGVAGPDAETQMTGDAGTRVACGVIASPKPAPSASASSRSGQHW